MWALEAGNPKSSLLQLRSERALPTDVEAVGLLSPEPHESYMLLANKLLILEARGPLCSVYQ